MLIKIDGQPVRANCWRFMPCKFIGGHLDGEIEPLLDNVRPGDRFSKVARHPETGVIYITTYTLHAWGIAWADSQYA